MPLRPPTAVTQSAASPAPSRDIHLDALRAAAAVMVFAHHVVASGMWDMAPIAAFAFEGYRGVLVFFVLSGFVIARPFARGPVAMGPYLAKRILRIMPAYLVALVGVTIVSGDRTFLDRPLEHILLLQEYDPALSRAFLPPAWTLVIEVAFYALLPLAIIAWRPLRARSEGMATLALVGVAVLSLVAHVTWGAAPDPRAAQVLSLSFPGMAWAFVPGVLLAHIAIERPTWARRLAVPRWTIAGGVLAAIGWMGRESAATEVALVVGVAILIPSLCRPRTTDRAWIRVIAAFGLTVSYAFYLWHMAIMEAVAGAGLTGPVGFGVTFLATTLVGLVSFRLIERPAMQLSRRIGVGPPSQPEGVRPVRYAGMDGLA